MRGSHGLGRQFRVCINSCLYCEAMVLEMSPSDLMNIHVSYYLLYCRIVILGKT